MTRKSGIISATIITLLILLISASAVFFITKSKTKDTQAKFAGELQLSLERKVIYKDLEGECIHDAGFFKNGTECFLETLVTYKASGDLEKDKKEIAQQIFEQNRDSRELEEITFGELPYYESINGMYGKDFRHIDVKACLMIVHKDINDYDKKEECTDKNNFKKLINTWPDDNSDYIIGIVYTHVK